MGFCGIGHWHESDNAADTCHRFEDQFKGHFSKKTVTAFVEKHLLKKDNAYNTPGFIDVALLLEDNKIPIVHVNKSTLKKLDKMLDRWASDPQFKKDIDRMKKFLQSHIK